MSYQVDSYGNAYFPAGVAVASIPATTGTQAKVLVPGPSGRISSATISQLITQSGGNLVSSIFGRTGAVVAREGDYTTDQITESGGALYFSTSRVRKSIFLTTFNTSGPATYDSTTGILNIPQYGSGTSSPTNFVPLTRTITINGQTADLSVDRIFSVASMVYPSAGIALSNGVSWEPSIINNSANWNTAFSWGNHALAGYLTSFTETDPIWTSEKVNYYTKTAADARYLQSYTETDPVWTADKPNYALKTYVDTSISNLIDTAPSTLNTLNELAAALGDDANFSTTITTLIGTKEPTITAGTTAQYWRGDKTWQTLPIYTLSGLGGEPIITAGTTLQYWRGDKTWQTLPIYVLPIATASVLGGIKVGTNLSINATTGVLDATFTYTLPTASATVLGGIKVGSNLSIDGNGILSAGNSYVLPTASTTVLGGIKVGTNLSIDANGVLSSTDTNTTYANFTRTVSGLVPNPGGATTNRYLREDGTWVIPPDTDTNTWVANSLNVAGYVAAPGAVANKVWKTDASGNPAWRDDADTTYTLAGLGGLPLAGGIMTGAITLKEGAANGLKFPNDIFGGSGDTAGVRLIARSGEAMSLEVYLTNDADDWFNISVPSDNGAKVNGNTIWHAANLTNLNQLTNGPGYISSYSETDTLGTVTNRGNSTTQNLVFSNGRKGLIGVYDAAQTQAIFAMGAAYVLTDGGASSNIGNLYGLAWSYNPDYGGAGNNPQSKAGLNHQLLLMQNGITTAAFGSGIWTSGNVTASTFIGSIAWTSVTSRPTALSSFTNDLGNYGGWYSASGGTISGDVTINGASNTPLTISQVQPYVDLNATGATNKAGIRIYPSLGYDADIGNFRGGALNLLADSYVVAKVTKNAGVIFYTSSTGPITSVGSNTSASMVFINGDSSNKTWDISMYANDWILNESNVTTRFKVLAGGGVYADAFYEFSDKRHKTLVQENPNITDIGSITTKLYIKEGKTELGYFAQDFEGVLDSAILKDKDGVLSLSYRQVHTAKIAALEKRIAELEAKLK